MSILSANLKHLYQRRMFWIVGLLLGAGAFAVAAAIAEAVARNKSGAFCGPALWMFPFGILIATLPVDVLTKPFIYCLPGHGNVPRKFLFSIGLCLSFLWSLSFLFFPGLNPAQTALACLSAFATLTVSYWFGAWIVFRYRSWPGFLGFFPLLMLANMWLNISTPFVHAIVANPLPMILLGALANVLAWRYWSRPGLARRYCGQLWMNAFDGWDKEKVSKLQKARLAEKDKKKPNSIRISPAVEEFFLSRIRRADTAGLSQYLWGGLYNTFGLMISRQRQNWINSLLIMVPLLCFLCYMPGRGKNIIFILPGIMAAFMSLNVHSSLLISGGRRERFWTALTLAAASAVLVTLLLIFLAVLTILLAPLLPEFTIKGENFIFHPLTIALFFLPLVIVPFTLIVGLVFPGKGGLALILAMIPFNILFMLPGLPHKANSPLQIGPLSATIMVLGTWTLFVAVLRHITTHCSLVHQTR